MALRNTIERRIPIEIRNEANEELEDVLTGYPHRSAIFNEDQHLNDIAKRPNIKYRNGSDIMGEMVMGSAVMTYEVTSGRCRRVGFDPASLRLRPFIGQPSAILPDTDRKRRDCLFV